MEINNKKETIIQIRIEDELKNKYVKFCNENGYTISKRIRLFIEKELDKEKILNTVGHNSNNPPLI